MDPPPLNPTLELESFCPSLYLLNWSIDYSSRRAVAAISATEL